MVPRRVFRQLLPVSLDGEFVIGCRELQSILSPSATQPSCGWAVVVGSFGELCCEELLEIVCGGTTSVGGMSVVGSRELQGILSPSATQPSCGGAIVVGSVGELCCEELLEIVCGGTTSVGGMSAVGLGEIQRILSAAPTQPTCGWAIEMWGLIEGPFGCGDCDSDRFRERIVSG